MVYCSQLFALSMPPLLLLATVAISVCLLLAAPGRALAAAGAPESKPMTPMTPMTPAPRLLRFWTMQLSPFHDAYVQGLILRFEAQHPGVRVQWVDVPWPRWSARRWPAWPQAPRPTSST